MAAMAIIKTGAEAPNFKLDDQQGDTYELAQFRGSKNVLLVLYPLDFTPT